MQGFAILVPRSPLPIDHRYDEGEDASCAPTRRVHASVHANAGTWIKPRRCVTRLYSHLTFIPLKDALKGMVMHGDTCQLLRALHQYFLVP